VTGIRSKIVHDYMSISYDVVWAVVIKDMPSLLEQLTRAVAAEGG
jgi:uncharacterized protein with HEPN domain